MANEKKNLKGLTDENKESVAGGDIHYSSNGGRSGHYYVPDPSGKRGKFYKLAGDNTLRAAIAHETAAGRGTTVHRYSTFEQAIDAAADEGFEIAYAKPKASEQKVFLERNIIMV